MNEDIPEDFDSDRLITVMLPRKDYLLLREMLDEQEVHQGIRKFLTRWGGYVMAVIIGVSTLLGLISAFKDYKP